jgi:hypothetical protein
MSLRSLGNPIASFLDYLSKTGTDALKPPLGGISATGGTITTSGLYTIHTFTSSGTFSVTSGAGEVEYLVVAGGGGNAIGQGGNRESGSGAGGLLSNHSSIPAPLKQPAYTVSPGPYVVTVGGGGGGKTNGAPSSFGPITSTGGGAGANFDSNIGSPGGSGGGNWYSGATPATGISGQGNPGGIWGGVNNWVGGGGGGADGPGGVTPTNPSVGAGGAGLSVSISGSPVTYAAGGRSSEYPSTPNAANGANNTGNGASGAANGGPGIVIIRYIS